MAAEVVENMKKVQGNIADACARVGRDPREVTLIAVSKTKPEKMIEDLYAEGQRAFGENYVQELTGKYEDLPKDIQWHMIGHLQRNKVKYIADKVAMIHSVDSLRLAEQISREAVKCGRTIPVLVEVNVAGEETKFGVKPEDTEAFVREIAALPAMTIEGLMTSAPPVEDPEDNRPVFRRLRELSVDIRNQNIDNVPMSVLSMGMTNDYVIAVEEGATMVRVGTAIFGARNYNK